MTNEKKENRGCCFGDCDRPQSVTLGLCAGHGAGVLVHALGEEMAEPTGDVPQGRGPAICRAHTRKVFPAAWAPASNDWFADVSDPPFDIPRVVDGEPDGSGGWKCPECGATL